MKDLPEFQITREKHLDHMVRVVPLIFLGYAIQAYFLSSMSTAIGTGAVLALGGGLAAMIGLFVFHDVTHEVSFYSDHLTVRFLGREKNIFYVDIQQVRNSQSGESFSHLHLFHGRHRTRLFFVDEADKVQAFIEDRKRLPLSEAA